MKILFRWSGDKDRMESAHCMAAFFLSSSLLA